MRLALRPCRPPTADPVRHGAIANAHAAGVVVRKPTTLPPPYSPAHSVAASPRPRSGAIFHALGFRETEKPPTRNPDDRVHHNRSLDRGLFHQIVNGQPKPPAPLAISQPADASRQPLKLDALASQFQSAPQARFSGKSSSTRSSVTAMSEASPESAAHRKARVLRKQPAGI